MDHSKTLGLILLLSGLGVFLLHVVLAVDTGSVKECFNPNTAMTKIC